MIEVTLTVLSPDGTQEVSLEGNRLSVGRTDEAALMINDNGLSRLHATIHRDGDRVWILDENSTNGTEVNGAMVPPSGTPLKDGDEIIIGNDTVITVNFNRVAPATTGARSASAQAGSSSAAAAHGAPAAAAGGGSWHLPYIGAIVGIIVVLLAVAVIGSLASRKKSRDDDRTTESRRTNDSEDRSSPTPSDRASQNNSNSTSAGNSNSTGSSDGGADHTMHAEDSGVSQISSKVYLEMTPQEQNTFIAYHAQHVARMIGNRESEAITPQAIERIKSFLDTYARRVKWPAVGRPEECHFTRDNLQTLLERASRNAPFIVEAFRSEQLPPQLGLYLAMIESEHCVCLQSPTGPLGMFQFTQATGRTYGLAIVPGASPSNPDERCKPEPAARAAAKYMKFLTARYGTGPLSVPLAIASYNSGEGGLSTNLSTALAGESEERSFWTLVANEGKLSSQFQKENVKYVPKFFAAAIVGELPQNFGIKMQALSSYTQR